SVVQAFPSLQFRGVPAWQAPPVQVSVPLQAFPSLQRSAPSSMLPSQSLSLPSQTSAEPCPIWTSAVSETSDAFEAYAVAVFWDSALEQTGEALAVIVTVTLSPIASDGTVTLRGFVELMV